MWDLWMRRALALAALAEGRTSPNPLVGAVVLDANGSLVGEGFHARAGEPHAEVGALAQAGDAARGGTLVVTLEPCCHHGRTPPCTQAVLKAGLARVVVALEDPDPRVAGAGIRELRQAGVEVINQDGQLFVSGADGWREVVVATKADLVEWADYATDLALKGLAHVCVCVCVCG